MLRGSLLLIMALCAGAFAADGKLAKDKNTISDGADGYLMLRGKDPVSYFTQPEPLEGKPGIKAEHDGATYRFATEENRRLFVANPGKYAPMNGGHCSNGMVYAIGGSNGENHKIIDGKLYVFGGPRSKAYFEMEQDKNVKLSAHYWESEYKGNDWREVSKRRSSWGGRVDHYKTNRELAAEYEKYMAGKKQ